MPLRNVSQYACSELFRYKLHLRRKREQKLISKLKAEETDPGKPYLPAPRGKLFYHTTFNLKRHKKLAPKKYFEQPLTR